MWGLRILQKKTDDRAYLQYLRALAIQKLREYNADPNNKDIPLTEADGTVVTFE